MTALAPDTLDKLRKVSTATITSQLIKIAGLRTRSPLGVRPSAIAPLKYFADAAIRSGGRLSWPWSSISAWVWTSIATSASRSSP